MPLQWRELEDSISVGDEMLRTCAALRHARNATK
jgi:hypothetical protein